MGGMPQAPQVPQTPAGPTPEEREEIDSMLEEILEADGIITAKEREALLRKAVAIGIDRDEYDSYIDDQLKKLDESIESMRRENGKLCPYCETAIPFMAYTCPGCGKTVER